MVKRFLTVSWKERRWNQLILKEINPESSLKGLILKRKLQYFGHLMRRDDLLEETLMMGKIEGGRTEDEMVGWYYWLNGREFEQTPGDGDGQGSLELCGPWCHRSDMTERLNSNNRQKNYSRKTCHKTGGKKKQTRKPPTKPITYLKMS